MLEVPCVLSERSCCSTRTGTRPLLTAWNVAAGKGRTLVTRETYSQATSAWAIPAGTFRSHFLPEVQLEREVHHR